MMTEYVGTFACPIELGHSITIAGKTIDGANKFEINLRTSKKQTSDVALAIVVKFNDDVIVRNSKINNQWGEEERNEYLDDITTTNPFISGETFLICLFACETKFFISCNRRPFCTYKYRLPIEEIRTIYIDGHVQTITQVDHRTIYPFSWPKIQCTDPGKVFSNDIPILFSPGHCIVITGIPFNNINGQFIIKFTEGETKREGLHFNPRFHPYYVVVRNAMKTNYEFGIEERDGGFPFVFEQQFRLAIAFTEKSFLFAVNGVYLSSFLYRSSNLLDVLSGFKVATCNGMCIHITSVDHLQIGNPDCDGFVKYSEFSYDIV